MRSRTNITTEYAPCGLTPQGIWRPLDSGRYRSKETAEAVLENHKKNCAANPRVFKGCEAYMVMKRTVVTTIGEWEGV